MQTLWSDLAFAVRGLVRRPAFTVIVVATIALGVGANAAIFSVVSGILLRPLPYPHAERVISFGHEPPQWLASQKDFVDYQREMRTLEALAAYTMNEVTLSSPDDPERLRLVRATDDFFPLLGVPALVGRTFSPDEFTPTSRVVVLSYGLWQRHFGGRRSVVGEKMPVNGAPATIVGVMPPHFDFPEARTDLWWPFPRMRPDSLGDRNNHYLFMVGRMKPGITVSAALSEASAVAKRIMRDEPKSFDPANPLRPHMDRVQDKLVGPTRPYLIALLGAVGFVLLIACANVANLLLVRAEGRRRELALRGALGASGSRLMVHLLAESGVLAVGGGLIGLGAAWAGQRLLVSAAPSSVPRLDVIAMRWNVVAFTALVTGLTAIVIGIMPALRAARESAADALRLGGRTAMGHVAGRARRTLVAAEVALAVVTLFGAGLLLRSLWNLQSNSMGFVSQQVLTAKVAISQREYNDARATVFFDELMTRVRALSGVRSAGAAGWLPVVDAGGLWGFTVEGRSYDRTRWPMAVPQHITPGYLQAIGLPLLEGRDVTANDREGAPYVVLVSRSLANTVWPGASPLGQRIIVGGSSPPATVVGVVGDIRARGFDDVPEPTMYFPYAQAAKSAFYAPRTMALVVKTVGDPRALVQPVRGAVRALDRTVPVSETRTLDEIVGVSVANRRFTTLLLVGFATLALVLAALGIYGVISYGVAQRTGEIGVRMALGAERGTVLRLVLAEALRMSGAGLFVGLVASVAVARVARALLVGVSIVDPATLACVSVTLLGVAALAAALPARRASSVSPSEALRT